MKPLMRMLGGVLVLALLGPVCSADERTWMKSSHRIADSQGEPIAEFTNIVAIDQGGPMLSRVLYGDASGNLFVIRFLLDGTSEHSRTEYTFLATGESVVIDVPDGQTVTFSRTNGPSVTFPDADPVPAPVRVQAVSVVAGASQQFKDALRGFAQATIEHSSSLLILGMFLGDLLYPDIDAALPRGLDLRTGSVLYFDPNTTPPTAFEQQFGQAYYE